MTEPLRVVSLFSGVGGFDVGLERAGMVTVAQVEWDKKCQGVLRRHWPDVPKFSDVSDVHGSDLPPCDLVAFGSPCQDLSKAGKRAGLEGNRSGLFFEAIRIIQEMLEDESRPAHARPRWVVWENVVGSLTSNHGLDYAAVLDSMGELRGVEQVEWRVLDAQHFGTSERPVPQRRRRLFLVACLDSRAAGCGQVLPVGESVPGDSDQGNKVGPVAATRVFSRADGEVRVRPFVKAKRAQSKDDYESWKDGVTSPTLNGFDNSGDSRATVATVEETDGQLAVRRLTPLECERLQGWDDDWTRWDDTGKEQADTVRYKQTGNGVASPVAEWLGRCIILFDQKMGEKDADNVVR